MWMALPWWISTITPWRPGNPESNPQQSAVHTITVIPKPNYNPLPTGRFSFLQWFSRILGSEAKNAYDQADAQAKKCLAGAKNINGSNVARGVFQGGIKGIAKGATKGAIMGGEAGGPEGAAAGGLSGGAIGGAKGIVTGGAEAAVKDACK